MPEEKLEVKFILNEIEQHHLYARHNAQLIMAWYTFFITGNLIATGWLFTGGVDLEKDEGAIILIFLSSIFFFVNMLGIRVSNTARNYVRKANKRVVFLLNQMAENENIIIDNAPISPMPAAEYDRILWLMRASIFGLLFIWGCYDIYVIIDVFRRSI